MNDLDNELSRTLHRRAENLSAVPLAFDDVRGKATSIRRRRQLATGLGVAAAIAVMVPTAMFASQNINTDNEIAPANTPAVVDTNGPTPTEGPTMGEDAGALDVADLPTGAEPEVQLVTGADLALAKTDEATVHWKRDGESLVVTVEAGGRTFGPYPSSSGPVRNQAGTAVVWATDDGDIMAWDDGGNEPFVVGHSDLSSLKVTAVTGTVCSPGTPCLIYGSGWDMDTNRSESFSLSAGGEFGPVLGGALVNVSDAHEDGRLVGQTEITDGGSCSAVFDPLSSSTEPVFDTCNHTLESFSYTGDYVLASDPYHSGIGSGQIAIYDAHTGELLANRLKKDDDMAFYNSAVWEDSTHVLFSAYQDGQWSIVRMDVNGAMEYAVAPEKGDAEQVPWHFETR